MRCTQTLLATMRETPAEAEIVSHRLMLRAGLVRLLASGLYTWLPLGMRVLRKVEAVVREEMNAAGAQEVLMPAVQPAELWEESGRWSNFGPELLRLKDRHERDFCVGPTHEEVITDIARREIRSYKQLPINLYQIQTKFRDEIRPRFGVMRAREFIMKDAYSFDLDAEGLERSYLAMHDAYCRTFERLGLDYRVVDADSGAIGGSRSQEFHVLADYGEDAIAFSDGGFAANVELVPCPAPGRKRSGPTLDLAAVDTPGRPHHCGPGRIPRRAGQALRQDPPRRGRGRRPRRARPARRSRAQRDQGGALRRRTRAARLRPARARAGGHRMRSGVARADRRGGAGGRRRIGRGARRLRVRRKPRRCPSHGRELGPGRPGAGRRRPSQRHGRRPEPGRVRSARGSPRHRGRAHLPARRQVQRVDGRGGPRR